MTPVFGVHTGLEGTTIEELRATWSAIEDMGFGWISVWDHLHSSDVTTPDPSRRPVPAGSYEAVAAHAALACATTRVRCGALVYCVGYRHPAVIAHAASTIDHLSGGRAEVGLGAGWAEAEYRAYGLPFPPAGVRLDALDEAAACVRSLLHQEVTDFAGEHFTLTAATCAPRPIQPRMPLWIGGGGERRTLRIVARHADGWNVAFVDPAELARKRGVLDAHCADVGRDPATIRCSINVGLAAGDDDLAARFGAAADRVRPAVLMGSAEAIADHLGRYLEAGADQVNVAVRAPWDMSGLERVAGAAALLAR